MDPEHDDEPTLPPTEGPVTIDKGILRAVLDACTGTLDFGSGFLVDEEVLALREAARLIDLDPNLVTPSNFACKYDPPHLWRYGKSYSSKPRWHCPRCGQDSEAMPADWTSPEGWEPLEPDPPRPPTPGLMSTSVGLLRSVGVPTGTYWWISGADPTRSGGEQFRGVVIVEANQSAQAVQKAIDLGLVRFPSDDEVTVTRLEPNYVPGSQWRDRLLSRTEAEQAERSLYGPLSL